MKAGIWIQMTLLILLVVGLPACGDDASDEDNDDSDGDVTDDDDDDDDEDGDDPTDGDDADGDTLPPFELPQTWLDQSVSWTDCDLYEDLPQGVTQKQAQCTEVQVPLFWDDPDNGETITLAVKRILGPTQPAARQLWLLEGGPGGSSIADFPGMMDNLLTISPDTDSYAIDHRGVGLSTRMGCPAEDEDSDQGRSISNEEWEACTNYLLNEWHDPNGFTVTNAAIDVGYMAELNREENKDIFVYGVSYGTYWGHRYAQIFPEQSRGIILDSVAPSDPGFLDQFDIQGNVAMHQFFDACAQDEFCHEKYGDTPYETAVEALHQFRDTDHCSVLRSNYGITAEYLQWAAFSVGQSWYGRTMVPPLFYRLNRCDDDDVQAIVNMIYTVLGTGQTEPTYKQLANSYLLGVHIGTSEMLSEPVPTVDEIQQAYDEDLIQLGVGRRMVTRYHAGWPRYDHDAYVHQWASLDVPLLMMNGTLDLQTPIEIANVAKAKLTGPHQYFVTVPNANHCVLYQSPVSDADSPHCGMSIMLDYFNDPLREPDTSCLNDLLVPDYQGYAAYGNYYFQTTDLWENVALTLDCPVPNGFLDNETDSYTSLVIKGQQTTQWQVGQGEYTAQLDGTEVDVDSYAIWIHPSQSESGTDLIAVDSYGNFRQIASNHRGYRASQLLISKTSIQQLKDDGENQLDFNPVPYPFYYYITEVEEKQDGDDHYNKFCPKAITDFENMDQALYVCHEQNTTFDAGEEIQLAGNMMLSTDAEDLTAAFGHETACTCSKNQTEAIDCADFDALTPAGRKKAQFRPSLPPRPGLPTPHIEPEFLNERPSTLPILDLDGFVGSSSN